MVQDPFGDILTFSKNGQRDIFNRLPLYLLDMFHVSLIKSYEVLKIDTYGNCSVIKSYLWYGCRGTACLFIDYRGM